MDASSFRRRSFHADRTLQGKTIALLPPARVIDRIRVVLKTHEIQRLPDEQVYQITLSTWDTILLLYLPDDIPKSASRWKTQPLCSSGSTLVLFAFPQYQSISRPRSARNSIGAGLNAPRLLVIRVTSWANIASTILTSPLGKEWKGSSLLSRHRFERDRFPCSDSHDRRPNLDSKCTSSTHGP